VLDTSELPRVEYDGGKQVYVFVRVPRMTKRGEVVTSPLVLVSRDALFITLSASDVFRPQELIQRDQGDVVPSSIQMLLGAFAAVIAEYEELIHRTTRIVRDVSHRLRTHEVTNQDFVRFVSIEDNLNEYRTNLEGMQALAMRLREDRKEIFDESDKEMIDDTLLHLQQLLAATTSQRQSVESIRNAYSTIANNSLNQRMKTLTVLTVLIALPNVFYGMYGMNVALPFADQPWAYALVVAFTIVVIFVVYWLARRFKIF
jgi:magnesium transporter